MHAADSPDGDGTALFSELTKLIDDVPPEQIAGAHPRHRRHRRRRAGESPPRSASTRRSTRSITGQEGEHDRRIVLDRAPRFAILGEPQSIHYRVLDPDLAPGRRSPCGSGSTAPRWRATASPSASSTRSTCRSHMPAATSSSSRSRPADERAGAREQRRRRRDRRGARAPPRAPRLRRAACRRAHLAERAEVRRGGRPRALHHSAAAGEAGRHADQRAVADRLPDPRAVRGEDRPSST